MTKQEIIDVFKKVVTDYHTHSALFYMFYGTSHDIVCAGGILFAHVSDNKAIIGNMFVSYADACAAWKEFDDSYDVTNAPIEVCNDLLIHEGSKYYFYKKGEESALCFVYKNGDITYAEYKCTIANVEVNRDGQFIILSRFRYFEPFVVQIDAMKNDIVKMSTI